MDRGRSSSRKGEPTKRTCKMCKVSASKIIEICEALQRMRHENFAGGKGRPRKERAQLMVLH